MPKNLRIINHRNYATVAQWQSSSLVMNRLSVRFRPVAPYQNCLVDTTRNPLTAKGAEKSPTFKTGDFSASLYTFSPAQHQSQQ